MSPSIALYQRPGTTSPWAQTPDPKNGRKNSSAITRSWPSQSGCDALQRAGSGVPVEAGVEAELPAELIADVAEDGVLGGVEHGPERDRVDQLRVAQPALQEDHDPVRVDVVAAIDRARVPQVIGELLLARRLVDVPHQRVAADRQLAQHCSCRPGSRYRVRTRPTFRPAGRWRRSQEEQPEPSQARRIRPGTSRRSRRTPRRSPGRSPTSCRACIHPCPWIGAGPRPGRCRRRTGDARRWAGTRTPPA